MKAIIDVAPSGTAFDETMKIARRVDAGEMVPEADYTIHFSSARQLLSHLTGARMELLNRMRRQRPCSVNALAKSVRRNYSNAHPDMAALEDLGLVERDETSAVLMPFDKVEIHLGLDGKRKRMKC